MRNSFSGKVLFTIISIFILFISSTGYSQQKTDEKLPVGSIKLEYKYLSDKFIQYVTDTKLIQDMDINGQSMLVNVDSYMKCSVKTSGKHGDNLRLVIKIDSLTQNVDTPQGAYGGSIPEVINKEINIEISPSGRIIDLSEAAKLVFNIPGSGESDASEAFSDYFPELPKGSVKKGDSWIMHDTINIKSKSIARWMPVESDCKFEAIENFNGYECAKISATISGSMKITNYTQGMEINTSGTYTGTKVLLFAIREGFFVRETNNTKMKGTVDIPDQNMTLPVVMDIVTVTKIGK